MTSKIYKVLEIIVNDPNARIYGTKNVVVPLDGKIVSSLYGVVLGIEPLLIAFLLYRIQALGDYKLHIFVPVGISYSTFRNEFHLDWAKMGFNRFSNFELIAKLVEMYGENA